MQTDYRMNRMENNDGTIESCTIADGTIPDSLAGKFRTFENLTELMEHVKHEGTIYYQAPMDVRPALLQIKRYLINREDPQKSSVTIWTPETKTLTFPLMEHFGRFRTITPKRSNSNRVTRDKWWDFDGVDCPEWLTEEQANLFCSLLNSYIPEAHGRRGCRYHTLNRFPSGRLYIHLINAPTEY